MLAEADLSFANLINEVDMEYRTLGRSPAGVRPDAFDSTIQLEFGLSPFCNWPIPRTTQETCTPMNTAH